jgi:Tfp pilus assembly protein PilX
MTTNRSALQARHRGNSVVLVLILLSVMLVGALAMARMAEVSTLAGGNAAASDAAMQASEVGLNTAFAAVRTMAGEDAPLGNWYFPTAQATDATGVPNVSWASAPEVTVGNYSVRYVVDRLCNVSPVTDTPRQCLIKQVLQTESSREGAERPDPPNSRQFRVTVRVLGPKDTQVWTQAMVTRGN